MDELPPAVAERAAALEATVRRQIENRARELWEADGRPAGRGLGYWLQAEQEAVYQSVAGEEDPLAGVEPSR